MTGTPPWDDYRYRIVTSRLITPVIRELWLAPDSAAPLPFRAGQYALLSDPEYRVPQRSYSIANAPRSDGQVSLLVTLVPDGPTSGWVHRQLQVGDPVLLSGPYGTFVLDDAPAPVLLLGAGSGLAPVRALAETLLAGPGEHSVRLVFSARSEADRIDHERFSDWARRNRRFDYTLALTRDPRAEWHVRVPELLPRISTSLAGWAVFASGPPGFVTRCAAAAQALGADPATVHTEEFFADPQPWTGVPPMPTGPER
jgi:CDP-4-dehydro-6-deoxyglucose reductase, E3